MNTIKGLIIKDLFQLKSYKKNLLFLILIYTLIFMSQASEGTGILVVMLTLFFGMVGISSISYDDVAKADRYILSMPITKKEIILSKYILIIGATLLGSIIGILLTIIISIAMNSQLPNMEELMLIALGGIPGVALIEAIQIPCVYKYGAEKGRLQIFVVVFIMALLLGGIAFLIEKMSIELPIESLINLFNSYGAISLVIATILIYAVSYLITYRIYSKKEF